MINAIVLAAGESKRMGRPKALLWFPRRASVPARLKTSCEDAGPSIRSRAGSTKSEDTTFLEQIISVLEQSEVDRITVVLGAEAARIQASTDLSGTDLALNEGYREGQLSSLIVGLRSLPLEAEAILLCLVDNPLITVGSVDGVIGAFRVTGKPIVVPVFEGRRGHPALFARTMFEDLLHAPADEGARYVVRSHKDQVFEVQMPEPAILARVDTPEDYLSHFGVAPRIIER